MSLTKQQEAFALNIIAGMNQTDAYKAAGYKCANDNVAAVSASELVRNPKVVAFVEAHRAQAAKEAQIDLAWLIRESVATYTAAKKDAAYGPAVSALKTIGVYTGFWDEKSTRHNINRTIDEYSDDDLLAHIESGSGAGTSKQASVAPRLN
jgi:hypothetical protein